MNELAKPATKLDAFPPRLRRVAEIMTNSIEFYSLKRACELANVNYDSAKTMISRYRRKGIDFNEFVSSKTIELLEKGKYDVYKSLRDKAISGSLGHQKLFSEIVGDRKDKVEIDHKITGLFAVVGSDPNIIPKDLIEKDKIIKPDGKQIIDIDYED